MNKYEFYSTILQEDFPVKYREVIADNDSEQRKEIGELREALARVEAERDAERARGDAAVGDANEAEAQLAEAVILIGQVQDCRSFDDVKVISRWLAEFLARHAQAEQQEAQGAQAGDERAAFEEWAHKNWPGAERKMLERNAQGAYKNSIYRDYFTGWQARAAQPVSSTTSDQYRAELYDEVWQNARSMGYGNVTDALSELERFKLAQAAAGKPAAVVEQTDYPYPVSSQIDVPLPVGTHLYTVQPAAVRGAEHE